MVRELSASLQRTPVLDAKGLMTRPWVEFLQTPAGGGAGVDGLFSEVAAAQVDEAGAFGEVSFQQNVVLATAAPFPPFFLAGTQVVMNNPLAPPFPAVRILNNQALAGLVAKLSKAPEGADFKVSWWRVPDGGLAPVLLATLVIAAGQKESPQSGPFSVFALDSVYFLIEQIGSLVAGDDLITGVAA